MTQPQLGDLWDGRYRILSLLGEGASSFAYQAEHEGELVAIKIAREPTRNADNMMQMRRDYLLRQALRDEALAPVFRFGWTPLPYSVAPYLPIVDGLELIGKGIRPSPDEAASVATQLIQTMRALYSAGVLMLDVFPQNLCLLRNADGVSWSALRWIDFGMCVPRTAAVSTYLQSQLPLPNPFSLDEAPERLFRQTVALVYALLTGFDIRSRTADQVRRRFNVNMPPPPLHMLRPDCAQVAQWLGPATEIGAWTRWTLEDLAAHAGLGAPNKLTMMAPDPTPNERVAIGRFLRNPTLTTLVWKGGPKSGKSSALQAALRQLSAATPTIWWLLPNEHVIPNMQTNYGDLVSHLSLRGLVRGRDAFQPLQAHLAAMSADARPLVIVCDDAHACDEGTLRAIEAFSKAPHVPVLFLLAGRDEGEWLNTTAGEVTLFPMHRNQAT